MLTRPSRPTPPAARAPARRRRFAAAALAIALAACGGDRATPTPDPGAPAKEDALLPKAEQDAPALKAAEEAPLPKAAKEDAPALKDALLPKAAKEDAPLPKAAKEDAPLPKAAKEDAPLPKAAQEGAVLPKAAQEGAVLPKAPDGILPPGQADRILKKGASSQVKLLDPGAAPHDPLVYAFDPGKQRLGMKLDVSMALSMGKATLPETTLPRIVMLFELAAGAAAGDTRVDGILQGVTVEATGPAQQQVASLLRPQIDRLKDLGIKYLVTPKGRVRDVAVSPPPGLPAGAQQMLSGMTQSFELLLAPLPDQPVGIGARWQAVARVASSGADLLQLATYTLRSRDGRKLSLDVEIVQLAASASIAMPEMPSRMAAKLRSFRSSGTGSTRIDTQSVAPESGQLDMNSAITVEVAGDPPEQSTVATTLAVGLYRPAE